MIYSAYDPLRTASSSGSRTKARRARPASPSRPSRHCAAGGHSFAASDEQAIHDYTIELLHNHRATDATYQRILDAYGTAGIVELTALIGYYAMVALTLNAHEIGVPDGATPPLPDLGATH